MKNSSKISIYLLIALIILVIVGFLVIYNKKDVKLSDTTAAEQSSSASDKKDTESSGTSKASSSAWIKSPKFGLLYSNKFTAQEYYRIPTRVIVYKVGAGTVPEFFAVNKANPDLSITWGGYSAAGGNVGTCKGSDYQTFQYGISDGACVKGYRSSIGHASARATLTKTELELFGDFVVKNNQ